MKTVSPLNYAFSIGRVRALERFLIRQEVFAQAIEAELSEALRLFVETDLYSEELLRIKDSHELEAVLAQELAKLKKLISDLLLDKQLLGLLNLNSVECAQKLLQERPGQFLRDYLMHLIDLHNIKTFLRLYILKEPPEKLKKLIIGEGLIKKETFLEAYAQDLSFFFKRLEFVHKDSQIIDYAAFLRRPWQKLQEESSFVSLEKASNDFLIEVLKPAKYISFGPEPVLAYYLAKVNEINLIRLIILAKLNAVSRNLVKERLNTVYA